MALNLFWLLGIKRTAGGYSVSGTQRRARITTARACDGTAGARRPMRCVGLGLGMGFPEIPNRKMAGTGNRELQVRMTETEMGFHGCHDRFSKMSTRELPMAAHVPRFLVIRSPKDSRTHDGTYCWYTGASNVNARRLDSAAGILWEPDARLGWAAAWAAFRQQGWSESMHREHAPKRLNPGNPKIAFQCCGGSP